MDLERIIGAAVLREAEAAGGGFAGDLGRATPLSQTGLDSLGFTTLVVELERELGVDPFGGDDEIAYPETFGELVDLYAVARARA